MKTPSDKIQDLKEINNDLLVALQQMLIIFDRDLPKNSMGREVCDLAKKHIKTALNIQ